MKMHDVTVLDSLQTAENYFAAYPKLAPQAKKLARRMMTDEIPYSKKYLSAAQVFILEDLEKIFEQTPDLPLVEVILKIWADRPKNMAPRLVRELTIFVLDEWGKLQDSETAAVPAEDFELAAA